jgi:hypothetical protein
MISSISPSGFERLVREAVSMRGGSAGRTPVLARRIMNPLKSNDRIQLEDGISTAEGLLQRTKVPGEGKKPTGVAAEIARALSEARQRLAALSSTA